MVLLWRFCKNNLLQPSFLRVYSIRDTGASCHTGTEKYGDTDIFVTFYTLFTHCVYYFVLHNRFNFAEKVHVYTEINFLEK